MSPDMGKMLIIWCKAKKAGTKLYIECADNAVVHYIHSNEIREESRVTVMVIFFIVRHVIFKNLKILLSFSYDKCKWFSILGKATNMLSVEVNSKATLFPLASSNSPTRWYSPDTKEQMGECQSTSLRPLKPGARRPRGSRASAAGEAPPESARDKLRAPCTASPLRVQFCSFAKDKYVSYSSFLSLVFRTLEVTNNVCYYRVDW